MKKATLVSMVILAVFICFTAYVFAQCHMPQTTLTKPAANTTTVKPVSQTKCPVMGNPINKKYYVDYQGKRIYVCCPACVDIVKKDPEKYLQILKKQGVTPETISNAK